ncbi:DUF3592 domain-containing protein [Streptomyces griseiscabiei]|uniref:DUF3592 domain-containing protein n=1 Tax=Streptomyces griseiscabiei TaxID=2993540 RepID=A0ABU4L7Q0_9ACTN|nr:DUF3592 domain-containing protein [Streptomyces griseiscabiei]MBZ3906174.1 DUF3592 domain-containing protein [Streptomyces griseiscabiei]MDX2911169.1 DUF3592 domain-containing protein [Streptomyces griseiscabiei]
MSGHAVLEFWWLVPTGLALLGYGRVLAGVTRAQRAVWVTARIVEVGQPAHGDSQKPGIPVTLAFQDPATGREFTLSNTGEHGDAVQQAWVGREIEVRYPPGRPLRFAVVLDTDGEKSGRTGPDCAVMLLLVGLVIHATVHWGYPWALLGFGALLTAAALRSPDIRAVRARDALLASAVAVPARVVAVTRDVHTDDESGGEIVSHAPVITFTTGAGTHVTALARDDVPDPGRSLDRDLTIHYAPDDPSVYTPDREADRRSGAMTVAFVVALRLAGTAAIVVGAIKATR